MGNASDDVVMSEASALFKSAARLEREATVQKQQAARLMEHVREERRTTTAKQEAKDAG